MTDSHHFLSYQTQVITRTEELLVIKRGQVPASNADPMSDTAMTTTTTFTVLKRVVQQDRMLLVWERLVERDGAATPGNSSVYLSQCGCGQILRMDDGVSSGVPRSLGQSYIHMAPLLKLDYSSEQSTHGVGAAAEIDALMTSLLQRRHTFLRAVDRELEQMTRDVRY